VALSICNDGIDMHRRRHSISQNVRWIARSHYAAIRKPQSSVGSFRTAANWSNGFRGFVGGVPFENRAPGLTYGVRSKHWW
jgi:hypothetical protein